MAHRRTRVLVVLGAALALAIVLAGTPAANARWTVHNDADVTEIKAPPGGTQKQTCADRLRGRSGWSTLVPSTQDPNTYPIHDRAFARVRYEVWKAPAGFTSFGGAEEVDADGDGFVEDYLFTDANGNQFSSILVKRFRTDPRVDLQQAEAIYPKDTSEERLYVLTGVPFAIRFTAGTVARVTRFPRNWWDAGCRVAVDGGCQSCGMGVTVQTTSDCATPTATTATCSSPRASR